jgi:hypothetical protein
LNNRAENSRQPTRVREKVMRRFKSARHLQRFTSVHDQVSNLFMHCRYNTNAQQKRQTRKQAFEEWEAVTGIRCWIALPHKLVILMSCVFACAPFDKLTMPF